MSGQDKKSKHPHRLHSSSYAWAELAELAEKEKLHYPVPFEEMTHPMDIQDPFSNRETISTQTKPNPDLFLESSPRRIHGKRGSAQAAEIQRHKEKESEEEEYESPILP
ncbi:hypothetical protein GEMRC1_002682 [Eukaryota sp. GEM-RC1]